MSSSKRTPREYSYQQVIPRQNYVYKVAHMLQRQAKEENPDTFYLTDLIKKAEEKNFRFDPLKFDHKTKKKKQTHQSMKTRTRDPTPIMSTNEEDDSD